MIDVNTFLGTYPFRHLPHPEPHVLARVLGREDLTGAWVGHLPSAFHRDPRSANAELFEWVALAPKVLLPVPTIRPDWPRWRQELGQVIERGAVALRTYPQHWGYAPGDANMTALAQACAQASRPLILTVRFEDLRQRHNLDVASDLSAAHVRELARARTGARLIVTAAGRELIEEVHWGLTPEERSDLYWDISWLWGPPTDDLSHLFRTMGSGRFLYGSMWPLRLAQGPRANLALLEDDVASDQLADVRSWIVPGS